MHSRKLNRLVFVFGWLVHRVCSVRCKGGATFREMVHREIGRSINPVEASALIDAWGRWQTPQTSKRKAVASAFAELRTEGFFE